MLELHKDNFDSEVTNSSGFVLVDFWADTWNKCLELIPSVEELEKTFSNSLTFAKLNMKGNRRLAMAQKVMGLPAFVLFKDGERIANLAGDDIDKDQLTSFINSHIS